IGDVMEGGTVSEVVASNLPQFAKGDVVVGRTGWQTHALSDGSSLQIPHRVLDVSVTKISLQCSGVVTPVRQRVAARMSKHVRMWLEAKLSFDPRPLDHPSEPRGGERRAPLRGKYERRLRALLP